MSLIPVAFATGVVDTDGKFAAGFVDGVNNTRGTGGKIFRRCRYIDTGGKFATGVVDTGGALANISENFRKNSK